MSKNHINLNMLKKVPTFIVPYMKQRKKKRAHLVRKTKQMFHGKHLHLVGKKVECSL